MEIRKFKRALNALDRLRRDTKSMIPMETYHGMGNVLVRTYQGIYSLVQQQLDDPYIEALQLDLPVEPTDRQIAIQVNLLVGQLLAYVEDIYEELESAKEASNAVDKPKRVRTEEQRIQDRFRDVIDENNL